MKKTYIEPTVKVFKTRTQTLLAGSPKTVSISNETVDDYDVLE